MSEKRIVLLCATNRGYLFLKKLLELTSNEKIDVFSFREEAWEPPFFEKIKSLSEKHDVRVFEAKNVASSKWESYWKQTDIELMLVVSWRYLIPKNIFSIPKKATVVFHDSLLPRYRGFSPTVWAMINGENKTGVTLFEIAEDVDSGPIIDQITITIGQNDSIYDVMQQVTNTYLELLERNYAGLLAGTCPKKEQNHKEATFTCKRLPEDNFIDWNQSTKDIHNLVRATSIPYTGAYTTLNGNKLIIWSGCPVTERRYVGRIPGRIVDIRRGVGCVVLTGDGAFLIKQVQQVDNAICSAEKILTRLSYTLGK